MKSSVEKLLKNLNFNPQIQLKRKKITIVLKFSLCQYHYLLHGMALHASINELEEGGGGGGGVRTTLTNLRTTLAF